MSSYYISTQYVTGSVCLSPPAEWSQVGSVSAVDWLVCLGSVLVTTE